MNQEIIDLANDCGFTILNSPIWRAQGEKFLYQLLLQRSSNGKPLLFNLINDPLTEQQAKEFLR
jgi:hypothetical protein